MSSTNSSGPPLSHPRPTAPTPTTAVTITIRATARLICETTQALTGQMGLQPSSSLDGIGLDSLNLVFLVKRMGDQLKGETPNLFPTVGEFMAMMQDCPTVSALASALVARGLRPLMSLEEEEEGQGDVESGGGAVVGAWDGDSLPSSSSSLLMSVAVPASAAGERHALVELGRCLTGGLGLCLVGVGVSR